MGRERSKKHNVDVDLPGRGGDGMRDCLGEFESPEPAAPVDDPMMSIENLAVVAVLCCGRERPTTAEREKEKATSYEVTTT